MEIASLTNSSRTRRVLIIGGGALAVLLLIWVTINLMLFRAEARGLAEGYMEAAVTAYQMDRYNRPLPDRMFEKGGYRVETLSQGTPPTLIINVRDRYVSLNFWSVSRTFEVSGRPAPSPGPAESR